MKYTFEIMKEYDDAFKGISVYSVSEDKKLMVDFVAIEELEDAQKEIDEAYQRGLDDAWEAARKIVKMPDTPYWGVFGEYKNDLFRKITASEAIEKLKTYEEKQKADDEIKVGDEVNWDGDNYIVTYINIDIDTSEVKDYDLMMWDGSVVDHVKKCSFVKTGKRYDIDKILEEMRE